MKKSLIQCTYCRLPALVQLLQHIHSIIPAPLYLPQRTQGYLYQQHTCLSVSTPSIQAYSTCSSVPELPHHKYPSIYPFLQCICNKRVYHNLSTLCPCPSLYIPIYRPQSIQPTAPAPVYPPQCIFPSLYSLLYLPQSNLQHTCLCSCSALSSASLSCSLRETVSENPELKLVGVRGFPSKEIFFWIQTSTNLPEEADPPITFAWIPSFSCTLTPPELLKIRKKAYYNMENRLSYTGESAWVIFTSSSAAPEVSLSVYCWSPSGSYTLSLDWQVPPSAVPHHL